MRERQLNANWRSHFDKNFITVEQAAGMVSSGDRIYLVTQHEPPSLMASLIGRATELRDVELRSLRVMNNFGIFEPEWAPMIRGNVTMVGAENRHAVEGGWTDFTVIGFGDVNRAFDQRRPGSAAYDYCWLTVSPPNEQGFCCAGSHLWDLRMGMRSSKLNIAGINRHLPRTFGDTWIHVSEIDYFFAEDEPPPVRGPLTVSPLVKAVAGHVSTLIRDRDTIQVGMGSTSNMLALAGAFDDKEDLGYFAEMAGAGIIDLVKKGVINSKYATLHPNKIVTVGAGGSPEEYTYISDNPMFEFYDFDHMLNPALISRNDNMVSINNALSVDLRGQINVVSMGPKLFGGSGGQLAYHLGACMSKGGRAITVLPSTTSDGSISRIVSEHPQGQMVTVPWDLADTIVTEFGVADLVGKTMRERASALIEIAHPDHRPELRKAASTLL
ncbi:4-hydroxybutyrate coenzyme A transferase [Sphingobium indicum BiD32]|uniref:4-hydroxybutyrate coenzyme A transferase n=1 Tax=Sphingobium indicum BiD32 TaxID=1301087 RepID=N1MVK2_9SPHN|nr:acetyl-CoA hydrolase/transferase C-terminal domain-containing protein [Sphingobium indicum]CCW19343.1 4-hydroxybutyrate coenzyme A transferase [Sphingobium indicum BiD32]